MAWRKHLKTITSRSGFNQSSGLTKPRPIDIIIPVYNGFDVLTDCVESVLKHTSSIHPILILNDASTDPRVAAFLDRIEASYDHVKVIHREKNLGYLHNTNLAVTTSGRDVLLLNADTVVTEGWLDELQNIAADHQVGIACPLSNNATILSIKNHEPQHLDQLGAMTGMWYPIPTAVGFCMLIKKTVISALGGFDPYYHPGYGEECDYSMQLRAMGLQVAAAPAAFVYHHGSKSFKKQADKLQQQHQKLLNLRWPDYHKEITAFSSSNPTQFIDLLTGIKKNSRQARVLHVVHGLENKGGVELFTLELLKHLENGAEQVVLTNKISAAGAREKIVAALGPHVQLIELINSPYQGFIYTHRSDLFNSVLDEHFAYVLKFGRFHAVHFHSLVGMGSMIWPLICHQFDIPYFLFFHDHFGLCQIYSLVKQHQGKDQFCGKDFLDPNDSGCLECMQQKTKYNSYDTGQYVSERVEIWGAVIQNSLHLYFSSQYLQQQYQKKYQLHAQLCSVFEPSFLPSKQQPRKPVTAQVKIAFLGHFTTFKGAELFLDACDAYQHQTHIEWHILGGLDGAFSERVHARNILVSGRYETSELPSLLKPIDLVVLCSVFPDSYRITLSESLHAGVPVIAPDIGAFKSRINAENGALFKAGDSADLIEKIAWFINNSQNSNFLAEIKFNNKHNASRSQQLVNCYSQTTVSNLPQHNSKTRSLSAPKNSAYQSMARWLAAPFTLEAEADWFAPPQNHVVCVVTGDVNQLQLTKHSIKQFLPQAIHIKATDLLSKQYRCRQNILLIESGCTINENIGNWINAFNQADKWLGLADYALINHHNQTYAPQFQNRFSWLNHTSLNEAVGCLMINAEFLDNPAVIDTLSDPLNSQPLQLLVKQTYQQHNEEAFHYFPHFSYGYFDQSWVKNWKQYAPPKTPPVPSKKNHVLALVRTQLAAQKIGAMINNLCAQNGFLKVSVLLLSKEHYVAQAAAVKVYQSAVFEPPSETYIKDHITELKPDFIWLLNDNVHLNGLWCLNQMITCLLNWPLAAISPAAARSKNPHEVIANKAGGGLFFFSKGVLTNTSFQQPDHPIEHTLLDEDCALFTYDAWQKSQPKNIWPIYDMLVRSRSLTQQGLKLGVVNIHSLVKSGLPSYASDTALAQLHNERKLLVDRFNTTQATEFYSTAFSNRTTCQLDTALGTFKTPKHLPRILAYAHDSWGSGFYRIKSPLTALAADNKASTLFLPEGKNSLFPTPYEVAKTGADVLLLHNCFSDLQLTSLTAIKNQHPVPMVLSLDDLITAIPEYNPAAKKNPKDMLDRVKLAFGLADRVVVSTPYLAEQYQAFHHAITVIPNRISEQIWPFKHNPLNADGRLRIGWAGAGQHQADIAWLTSVIAATEQHVQWVFFGDKPHKLKHPGIEYHPPVPFSEYPKALENLNLDVGIAPLLDNPFNRAKSHLKLLEYGAVGAAVICSNLTPYDGSPALQLENDPALWIETILSLNQDRAAVATHALQISAWVKKHHTLENQLTEWLQLLKF